MFHSFYRSRFSVKQALRAAFLVTSCRQAGFYNELSIKNFVKDYDSDPPVKEYVEKLLEFPEIQPVLPEILDMQNSLEFKPNFSLLQSVFKTLVLNFMSYFQLKYFHNNIENATANNIALLNPQGNLHIPQFSLVPESTLNLITETKTCLTAARDQKGCICSCIMIMTRYIKRCISNAKPA